jgi:hypothetical protein
LYSELAAPAWGQGYQGGGEGHGGGGLGDVGGGEGFQGGGLGLLVGGGAGGFEPLAEALEVGEG